MNFKKGLYIGTYLTCVVLCFGMIKPSYAVLGTIKNAFTSDKKKASTAAIELQFIKEIELSLNDIKNLQGRIQKSDNDIAESFNKESASIIDDLQNKINNTVNLAIKYTSDEIAYIKELAKEGKVILEDRDKIINQVSNILEKFRSINMASQAYVEKQKNLAKDKSIDLNKNFKTYLDIQKKNLEDLRILSDDKQKIFNNIIKTADYKTNVLKLNTDITELNKQISGLYEKMNTRRQNEIFVHNDKVEPLLNTLKNNIKQANCTFKDMGGATNDNILKCKIEKLNIIQSKSDNLSCKSLKTDSSSTVIQECINSLSK